MATEAEVKRAVNIALREFWQEAIIDGTVRAAGTLKVAGDNSRELIRKANDIRGQVVTGNDKLDSYNHTINRKLDELLGLLREHLGQT
jgi:hypothetical protein